MVSIRRLAVCALFAVALLSAAEDRIRGPVDPARTVSLPGYVRPEAQPQLDLGPLDPALELHRVTLFFAPAPGLDTFLADLQTPGTASYHRWLQPEEFAGRFGLTPNDIAAVSSWLGSQGLHVDDVARGRHWITFSGTVDRLSRAFRTPIHRFQVNGAAHFANTAAPSIPQAFANVVTGVRGLHDFLPHSLIVHAPQPAYNIGLSHDLAPGDLAAIFDINALYQAGLDGTGQTIVIAGQTDYDVADIRAFRTRFGLASNDPQKVVYGVNPGKNSDLDEADLDMEWAGALAPNATIVFALSQDVFLSAQYAIDQNLGAILSMSYGDCEPYQNAGFMRGVMQQANAQGITLFAAAGDSASATCERGAVVPQASKGPTQTWPATMPEVTAAGGTAFSDSTGGPYWGATNSTNLSSALGYIPETVWNDSAQNEIQGTGGGPSALYAKPFWQTGPGVLNDTTRDIPDLSLPSSPSHYGYLVTSGGQNLVVGGTSAASPSLAGIFALLSQHQVSQGAAAPGLGNVNPALYRLAQATTDVFHDITTGGNQVACLQGSPSCVDGLMGFSAGPGYDMASGLGSVDAFNLVMEWNIGTASATSVAATPASGDPSTTIQLTATVAAVSAAGKSPTGSITFLAHDTVLGTAAITASGAATLSITGSALGAGAAAVTAYYPGDAVYTASSGAATVSIALPSGAGSAVVPEISPNPVTQAGIYWPYTITLNERAGVATTLTGFSVSGATQALADFTGTAIPANGSISTSLYSSGLTPPVSRTFTFSGKDPGGAAWSQQLVVSFTGPTGAQLAPAVSLTSPAATVVQNAAAPAACQFSLPITVQETGGFLMQLTSLTVSGASFTSQIQTTFGTTRLAPYGMVQGALCFAGATALGSRTVQLQTTSIDLGAAVNSSLTVTFAAAPASQTAVTVSPASVMLAVPDSTKSAAASIALTFASGTPSWTATVSPANSTTSWLTVSASGTANATLAIAASGTGLSPGAYRAIVSVQSQSALPQVTAIPVILVVGASSTIAIGAIANNLSNGTAIAPGAQVAVYGTNLAPATQASTRRPLLLTAQGVSATVNGISAPLYFVSPAQLDIQIPYEAGLGPAVLAVNNNGAVAAFPFFVSLTAPGLYPSAVDNSTGALVATAPQGQLLLAFMTGDGDVSPFLATGATPVSTTSANHLPKPILPVTVTVGGVPATVLFAGIAAGLVGVTQIDFTVPATAPLGAQPVVVTVGGVPSPPFTLTVTKPVTTALQ